MKRSSLPVIPSKHDSDPGRSIAGSGRFEVGWQAILAGTVFLFATVGFVVAQSGQVFVATLANPDHGSITPSGSVSVPVGHYARFFLTGAGTDTDARFEPAGFYVNGSYVDGALYESLVVSAGPPITVAGVFRPVSDTVAPVVKIVTPARSAGYQDGDRNLVTIGVTVGGDDEVTWLELYRNDQLVAAQTVTAGDGGYHEFRGLPLVEGDNLFTVRGRDADWNKAFDCVLVRYSAASATGGANAVVLIDTRLAAISGIEDQLRRYASLAAAGIGAGFSIAVQPVNWIDDWTTDEVRAHLVGLRQQNPMLEGVLLVGNIKLPSFYRPRGDITGSRLIAHKYEDLDIVLRNAGGAMADYDWMEKGANRLPELWCAVMPVGFPGGAAQNEYGDFAGQLAPYLAKLVATHRGDTCRTSLYQVSNQLWDLGGVASEWGMANIQFYAPNDTGMGPYHWTQGVPAGVFFRRLRTEWADFGALARYYRRFPWMGENWQTGDIYLSHLQGNRFGISWTNTHAYEQWSIIDTQQAKNHTGGALIHSVSGCSVAGFRQYGSGSYTDTYCTPDGNLLCGYVYGQSDAVAALGCPFDRGHECEFQRLAAFLAQGDYLGRAHFFRKCVQYHNAGDSPLELKCITQELLVGDPFIRVAAERALALRCAGMHGTTFEVTASGLVAGRRYVLKRSTRPVGDFQAQVGEPFVASAGCETLADPAPPAGAAFYRVEELTTVP